MAVPPPSPEKAAMRRGLRRVRADHVEHLSRTDGLQRAARQAAERLTRALGAPVVVALYHPIGGELDTGPLARALAAAGHRLALPRLSPIWPEPVFAAWTIDQRLVAGPYGIPQPEQAAAPVRPDVIVTPLVGFDRTGCRLGQGAGCYDRAFAACSSAWRIGYAWAVQEVETVPIDPWDMPLHAVVTEREWIGCGDRP